MARVPTYGPITAAVTTPCSENAKDAGMAHSGKMKPTTKNSCEREITISRHSTIEEQPLVASSLQTADMPLSAQDRQHFN